MKLGGGDVFVESATAFRKDEVISVVRLTAMNDAGTTVVLFMRPAEARKIGMDMIGAAHASVADSVLRRIAKSEGADGDGLVAAFRARTLVELP